ncbi:hypothetical protein [Catenulispora yoronensis]|uniref:hypothetical protein n=1 Tax=Catenulispora yoronensis TaxID=450799 RepID=UPI0031E2AF48
MNDTGTAGYQDTVLFAATYLDPKRGTVGFAAAARLADTVAARAAREAVTAYASALRTRQVIVADAGPSCECLTADGLALDDVGAAPCPAVPKALDAVRRFTERGDTVVVIGSPAKATVRRLVAQAPARTVPVVDADGVHALDVADPGAVAYVPAPGLTFAQAAPVVEALRSRFGRIPLQSPEDYCPAPSEQSAMLAALAAACDTVILLGAPSADAGLGLEPGLGTRTGAGTGMTMAMDAGLPYAGTATVAAPHRIIPVPALAGLTPELLAPVLTLGLADTGAQSALSVSVVLQVLSGLGPIAVRRMRVTSALTRAQQTVSR